jgi:hypothetical protein
MTQIEEILHDFLVDSLAEVKSDISKIDQIFDGKSEERKESIKQWIAGNDVKVIYHFPRDAAELPCYAIILESATESDQVIGESGDIYDEVYLSDMNDGWIGSDSDIHNAWIVDTTTMVTWLPNNSYTLGTAILPTVSNNYYYICTRAGVSDATEPTWETTIGFLNLDGTCTWVCRALQLDHPISEGPVNIKQFYTTAIEFKDGRRVCHVLADTGSLNKGIWIDFQNSVLEGGYVSLVGMGNVTFWVKSSRVGTFMRFGFGENAHEEQTFDIPITTKNRWERIRLDIRKVADRSKDKIRYMSFKIINASSDINIYIGNLRGEKSSYYIYDEIFFDHKYRIECWANNIEITLILYELARWYICKERTYLQNSWGLIRQRVEGGDIVPQPEYYPEFVYIRSLGYNCTTIELFPREADLRDIDIKVGRTEMGL